MTFGVGAWEKGDEFSPSGESVDPDTGKSVPTASGRPTRPTPTGAWHLRPKPITDSFKPGQYVPMTAGFADWNSSYNSSFYNKSELEGAYGSLDSGTQALFDLTAKTFHKQSTGSALFDKLVSESARITEDGGKAGVVELLYDLAYKRGVLNDNGELTKKAMSLTKSSSSGGGGSRYGAYTNSSVSLTNQFDAREVVDNALNQWLGRDATPEERTKFWKQLNAGESANPRVESGVTSKGGSRAVGSGGYNPRVAAEDFAKSRSDYAETTFATTAMDLIKESIMGDQTEGLM